MSRESDLHTLILAMADKLYLMSRHLTRLAERPEHRRNAVADPSEPLSVNGVRAGQECWLFDRAACSTVPPLHCPAAVVVYRSWGPMVHYAERLWVCREVFATEAEARDTALRSWHQQRTYHATLAALFAKAIRDLEIASDAAATVTDAIEAELGGES